MVGDTVLARVEIKAIRSVRSRIRATWSTTCSNLQSGAVVLDGEASCQLPETHLDGKPSLEDIR